MNERFHVAMEPTRREILHLIAEQEIGSSEIAERFNISRPAASQHLRLLREAGLVTTRKIGTRRLYAADREALAELIEWLDAFWSVGFSKLKTVVESKKPKTASSKRRTKE